jgi:DNA-binding IclR family transcriptional regulator
MTAIAKALTVLELAGRDESTGIGEIIAATGLPRSTVVRIVGELLSRQFLERTERGRYRPGPTIRGLARASSGDDAITARARDQLKRLVAATGETAHYAVYDAGFSVYVDKVDGSHPIRSYTKIGGRSPAYATATGKALLAWQDAQEIERVAAEGVAFTRTTRVGVPAVVAEEKRVRAVGYAVNRGEWRVGVWGVAAPVFDAQGGVVAAIGISGPEQRIRPRVADYAKLVVEYAARLSLSPANGVRRSA